MTGYIIRRLGQAVVVIFGVTVITFLMLHLLPGNLARRIVGPRATPQALAAFTKQYGLNKPFWYQYWKFLWALLHGNLGFSFHLDKSVNTILRQELSKDFLLGGISLFLATAIAIPVGIAQAVRRNGTLDYAGTSFSFAIYAMPQYWLGIILGSIFAIHWHLFPDPVQPDAQTFTGIIEHPANLVLPVATLTLSIYALFSRYMRSSAARHAGAGLHADRPGQGVAGAAGPGPALGAQLVDRGRDPDRVVDSRDPHGRTHRRAGVQLPGCWLRVLPGGGQQ